MKKLTAILLAILMLLPVAVSGLSAFAAVDVSVSFADSNPISEADVENAEFTTAYFLHKAEIDYQVLVTMPDGSKQVLNTDVNYYGTERYSNYGYAYVDFEECEIAKINGSTTVPVHVYVEIRDTYTKEKLSDYEFVVYKNLVERYITKISIAEDAPAFIYEKSDAVNFSATWFKLEYYNGTTKTVRAEKVDEIGDKPEYLVDGKPIRYFINRIEKKIFISYLDNSCTCDVLSTKEFPFKEIEIIGCTIKDDMPQTIKYHVTWKNGTAQTYDVNVNSYSGNINYLEGYNVSYSTEGSKYTSTVTVRIGDLSDSESYEIEQMSGLERFIAKFVLFIRKIFAAVFPSFDK